MRTASTLDRAWQVWLMLAAFSVAVQTAGGPATLTWNWANPSPHGNNIADLIYTNQLWVQVCERGQLYTSTDGLFWRPGQSGTTNALRAATFYSGRVIITGENGTILTGPTATNLTRVNLGTTDWLEGVTASPQLLVAVGDNGAIYTSPNGSTWQRRTSPITDWLRSVAYGLPRSGGLFVAVGETGAILSSADGILWKTQARFTAQNLNRVAWFGGQFWALGDAGVVFQSATGVDRWRALDVGATNSLNALTGLGTLELLAGDNEVRLSSNGVAWNNELSAQNPFPPPAWNYLSAAATTNSFLLGGRTGMMVAGLPASNGSTTWLPLSDSLRNWLWDVKHFPNLFLAVGDRSTLLSSPDGYTWQPEVPPDSATNSIFLGVGGKTNLAVVVGGGGTILTSAGTLQSSVVTNADGSLGTNTFSDLGIFWDRASAPTTADLQGVTVLDGTFIVCGAAGTILTSPDAAQWTRRSTPSTNYLSSVEAFPRGAVAVGKNGTILTSSDAVTWTARSSGTTNWLYRVRYVGGLLVAVGQNGTILTSSDGVAWTRRSSGLTSWLNDVQYLGSTFFAVGNQGVVLSSPDAITWTSRDMITAKSLFGAATDGGMLITVGVEGIILRSQVLPPDATAPVLSPAPADTTVSCDAVPAPATLTATSGCDPNPTVTFSETKTEGKCPQSYSLQRTWTATDACGNQSSASQSVTVLDLIAPGLTGVPPDLTVACGAVPPPATVRATDNCDPNPTVTSTETRTPGKCPQSYTLQRTWTATDACGNQSSASQSVTVLDLTAPGLSAAPPDVTLVCGAVPPPATLTATDNCDPDPVVAFAESRSPGLCPQSYTLQRTWTAADACGNQSSRTQKVTVLDSVAPLLGVAPPDLTVSCEAVPAPAALTATDNCDPNPAVTFSETRIPGSCPQSFTLVRTWTATDACGNQSKRTQTLTVRDTTAPELSVAPPDLTVSCEIVPAPAALTATDNCDPNPAVTFSETRTPGSCPQSFTLARTWTAADACGNQSKHTQTLTVQDTTAPELSAAPPDLTVSCDAVPTPPTLTAIDNCDPAPVVGFTEARAPGPCTQGQTILRTWIATDACGNQSNHTQKLTLRDTTAPVLSNAPADVTVSCDAVPPPAELSATDNCDLDPLITFAETRTPGRCPQSYTLLRTWTATDACGNQGAQSQTITVLDLVAPGLSAAPADLTVACGSVPPPTMLTARDNCDPNPVVAFTETKTPGTCPQSYTLLRTWTATDACGNRSSQSQTITVLDLIAPGLSGAPPDLTVPCDAVPPPAALTATDNCDPNPIVTLAEIRSPGACPHGFTLLRTWTATDACGNQNTRYQKLTILDSVAPVLSVIPADVTVSCDAVPAAASVTATDNCDPHPAVTFTETRVPSSCPQSYTLRRTWTATDACDNQSSRTQNVTVRDTTPPQLSAVPADLTVPCDAVPPAETLTATDNCDPSPTVTFTEGRTPGVCPEGYTLQRTWTATDACGNQSYARQTISVQDATGTVTFLRYPQGPGESLFLFAGPAGLLFALDRSTNAISWTPGPVLQIENTGALLYHDPTPNTPLRQFFRAVPRP